MFKSVLCNSDFWFLSKSRSSKMDLGFSGIVYTMKNPGIVYTMKNPHLTTRRIQCQNYHLFSAWANVLP